MVVSLYFLHSFRLLLSRSTPFPYTTLFRSRAMMVSRLSEPRTCSLPSIDRSTCALADPIQAGFILQVLQPIEHARHVVAIDRKSTRLKSSHLVISYAVFCLKKKKKKKRQNR